MDIHISIEINCGTSNFTKMVQLLHDDYQRNRKRGSKATPLEYVTNAVMTFPAIQKLFTYKNVCECVDWMSGRNVIVNKVGETTHLFNIVMAINTILHNGIKMKFKVGDILYSKKTDLPIIVSSVEKVQYGYGITYPLSNTPKVYDASVIESDYVKIGEVAK